MFDEGANGYVRAETVAAVMLSRESLARRAYARILGTRTNTDGYVLFLFAIKAVLFIIKV